jgi:indolepyruvate ferredoxin oxidoreductase
MLARLPAQVPASLLSLAKVPMDIRGYGPVKEVAVAEVKARVAKLLTEASEPAAKQAA